MSSSTPFPWRINKIEDSKHSSGPASSDRPASDLLRRVQDFLPQIQAANEDNINKAGTDNITIDECLVPQHDINESSSGDSESDDDDDNNDDEKPAAKRPKTGSSSQTIELDLTLGVDVNHPAMTLLGSCDDDNYDETNDTDEKRITEEQNDNQSTTNAIQNLLSQRNQVPGRAKGPLITEVKEEE